MRIIGNSSLDEPRAKILGMRARASRAVGPHKVGAYMSVWQLFIIYSVANTVPSGVAAMFVAPPRYDPTPPTRGCAPGLGHRPIRLPL